MAKIKTTTTEETAAPELAEATVEPGPEIEPDRRVKVPIVGPRVAVIGPESNGTRLMADLLRAAGCDVMHRSFPYGGAAERRWPEDEIMRWGPQFIVVMIRAEAPAVASAFAVPHEPTKEGCRQSYLKALRRIFVMLERTRIGFTVMTYEALVQRPEAMLAELCARLGVETPDVAHVYDGNEKYLGPSVVGS